MKLYDVNGIIQCGHRLYNVRKYVVANSLKEAYALFTVEHPHAKGITVQYKYELKDARGPHIIFTNLQKKS